MKYELAKQLKEAGFWRKTFPKTNPLNGTLLTEKQVINVIELTTLSELINACGEDFISLTYSADRRWIATGLREIELDGKNPEEAVAKLWLVLNKK